MKKLFLTVLLSLAAVSGFPCTNLIVGKLASTDGSVMCTYNCDSFGFLQPLDWFAAGKHAPGEMVAIRGWGPQSPVHYVAQADYTYGVVGLMNDHQVSIVETTWGGRNELARSEGALDYFTLMDLALQRSATAREAIEVMHNLVQEYGYSASGESFAVCDPQEAWIMELIGKGPGRKGQCIVIENAPLGVQAAHAAGCFTIGVTTGPIPEKDLYKAGADLVYKNMDELAAALPSLLVALSLVKA